MLVNNKYKMFSLGFIYYGIIFAIQFESYVVMPQNEPLNENKSTIWILSGIKIQENHDPLKEGLHGTR